MSAFPTRATLAGTPSKATAQAWFLAMFDALAQRLAAGTTGAGTATTAELAAARASLQVGSQGLKNRVINASGLVQQRSAGTLSASYVYGQSDRMMAAVVGGSSVSGSVGVLANAGFTSGVGYGAISAGWTTGQFALQHRLESRDVADLNGKTVTISCRLTHDFGSSRNFQLRLQKPTALDNHASATVLATSPVVACASGAMTTLSFQVALGSTDASNGLAILVFDSAANTVVSKTCAVGDLQLEEGAAATAFDVRPTALETTLCQRYYQAMPNIQFIGYNTAGNPIGQTYSFKTTMRATPSISGTAGYSNASGMTATASVDGVYLYASVTATGAASWQYSNASASAEL